MEISGSAGSSTSASVARSAANSSTTLSAGHQCGNPAESTESSSRSRTSKTRFVAAVLAATPFRNSASIGNDVVKQAASARPQNENLETAPGKASKVGQQGDGAARLSRRLAPVYGPAEQEVLQWLP